MKRQVVQDEFFDKQPPLTFIEYLKTPVHEEKPGRFSRTEPDEDEVSVAGLYLDYSEFPDERGLLVKSYEDFNLFLSVCGIGGKRYPIVIKKAPSACFEAYTINVTEKKCTIKANDTEGVRRALIYLEDEMTAHEGPLLPLGKISRKPWMKERITRGFFSPTNRPPRNGDELSDDIDYYPDEYLNRLMHDGTNGLWIYTSFRQLLKSSIIKEYGENSEKRIAKLNRVIAKCALYGVKVYVFAIEPMLWADVAENYPDMVGQMFGTVAATMCPHSERVQQYCYEAGRSLFTLCPDLAGFISITAGERHTSCASPSPHHRTCPRCQGMSRGQILCDDIELLRAGIRSVKPDAYCVSWTYGHRNWEDEDILEYVKGAPEDVMLMQNFDDRGFEKQLGKERQAMDYWLSYAGPSQLFRLTAYSARKHRKHLWAKMQICCSHEIATLPYVPSPGSVFQKMKGAYELEVEGVMECWYFGNYPCFMSKAAGELSFVEDYTDEDEFLHRLASICFGRGVAESVVRAWQFFEKGYRQYPLNIMFSYYSPMHDGVVWELALKPKNFAPSRSWLLLDKPDGDRVCDAMLTGHTMEEVLTLLSRMEKYYTQAMAELGAVAHKASPKLSDLLSVSGAFLTLCRSGKNIMEFYHLRDKLGIGQGDPKKLIARMRALVLEEIENSEKMISLCENDSRLGYHSEAEGFKFFPEKIRHRIETLKTLLVTEFPEVEERIEKFLPPLEYYLGVEPDCGHSYTIKLGDIEEAEWELFADKLTGFRIAEDEKYLTIDVRSPDGTNMNIWPEFHLFSVTAPALVVFGDGKKVKSRISDYHWSEHWPYYKKEAHDKELKKWKIVDLPWEEGNIRRVRITVKKSDFGITVRRPFKLQVRSWAPQIWEYEPNPMYHLGKTYLTPGCFGWVFFENGAQYPFVPEKKK